MIDTIYKSVRFLARLAVFCFSLLALLGAVIVAVTQISAFRSWALEQGLAALNGELQGHIEVEDVTGNFISGLTLHNVKLIAANTTMIDAPEVELHYQLRPILSNQIVGTRVYLNRPLITLIRNATDSTWNFDHITKPAVDSVKTPFNWDIDVDAFEIIDGRVQMHDLTYPQVIDTSSRKVDYAYLDIDHANLAVQAHIEPTTQSVWIQHLSFDLPKPNIQLIELAGRFTVDTTGLTVRDFRLETERTKLAMEARIDSINFLGVQEAVKPFIEYPMAIRLDAERVSTLELERFIPSLEFLGGDPSLQLDADGTLGRLKIHKLHLGLEDDSRINLTGELKNLDHAEDILIDATITDTRLRDRDTRTYVPGLNLPDLRYLGTVDIKSATYSGAPENFVSKIDATTEVGAVRGGVQMDLRPAVTRYVGDVAVIHGNLGPIINDSRYESDFTGRAVINGEGFSLNELNSRVRLESQASRFAGRTYRKIYLDAVAQRNGYLKIDTLLVGFGDGGNASGASELVVDTLHGAYISPKLRTIFAEPLQLDAQDRSILASGPFFGASGWLDMRKQIPSYDLYVRARDLNVEDITLNPEDRTRLTMTVHAKGSGFNLDDLEGTGTVIVQRASTSGKNIPPFEATYTLTRTDNRHRTLEFKSDFADAVISGEWRPEAVLPALGEGFGSIIDYINRKSSFQSEPFFTMGNRPFNESVNMHYDLVFRDLTPLEFFIVGEIDAIGHLSGDITGTPQILNISSAGRLDHFRYRDSSTVLAMDSAVINADLRGITPERIGEITTIDISVRSDSAVQFNDLSFRTPEASIQLLNGEVKVHGATNINNQISLAVDGVIDVNNPSGYRTVIDTLIVALPNGMQWRNYGPIRAVVAKDRIQLDSVAIQRRNREIVTIHGAIAGDRFENVEIALLQGRLGSLPRFLSSSDPLSPISSISGAIRTFEFTLNGTFDDPRFAGTLAIDSLAYSRNGVGDLRATLEYSNQNLTGKVAVINAPSAASPTDSALTVDIEAFPIDLAFASREERFISGRPVQITARSNDMSLSPVGQLIPGATVSGGTIDLNFTMRGTFDELKYTGSGQITNGRILVEGNNIAYLLPHAELTFEDNVLKISNATLRNDPRDYPRGAAIVKGEITFDGFSISNLDIQAETAGLLVLSDATQAVNDVVYGDLVIASQNGPIRFYGSLDQPYLEGDVSVVLGDLIFPKSTGRESNVNVVKYIDYEDWIKRTAQSYGPELPTELDTMATKGDSLKAQDTTASPKGGLAGKLEDISRTLQQTIGEATGGKSLTDQIIMDLYITIPSRLFIEMKFSDLETLEAELTTLGLPLRYRRGSDGENHLTGQVSVLQGSRYNFLKTFDATGNLNFTDKIDNVQLDLIATHNARTLTSSGDAFREYSVFVYITGTKAKPIIKFGYSIDGRSPAVANQDEIDANALSLLLFGRTKDELISANGGTGSLGQAAGAAGAGIQQLVTGAVSSVSSTVLAELLGSSRFIRSIELDLGNRASGDEARITVITQFGEVIIRYSGQISSPTNSTITIDMPVATLLNVQALRNFAAQLEVENSETSHAGFASTESQAVRARIQYRYYW